MKSNIREYNRRRKKKKENEKRVYNCVISTNKSSRTFCVVIHNKVKWANALMVFDTSVYKCFVFGSAKHAENMRTHSENWKDCSREGTVRTCWGSQGQGEWGLPGRLSETCYLRPIWEKTSIPREQTQYADLVKCLVVCLTRWPHLVEGYEIKSYKTSQT